MNTRNLGKRLTDVKKTLSPEGKAIVEALTKEIEAVESRYADLLEEKTTKIISEFTAKLIQREAEIDSLKQEATTLKLSVSKLEDKLDDAEAYNIVASIGSTDYETIVGETQFKFSEEFGPLIVIAEDAEM